MLGEEAPGCSQRAEVVRGADGNPDGDTCQGAGSRPLQRMRRYNSGTHVQDLLPKPHGLHTAHKAQQQVHECRGAHVLQHQAGELVFLLQEHNHLQSNTPISKRLNTARTRPPRTLMRIINFQVSGGEVIEKLFKNVGKTLPGKVQ